MRLHMAPRLGSRMVSPSAPHLALPCGKRTTIAAATREQAAGTSQKARDAVQQLHRVAEEAAQSSGASAPPELASSLEEMRQLLDALEAELRAADEEAAAAGTGPDTPIPLTPLPEALIRAQAPASPAAPRQQPQQNEHQQQQEPQKRDWREGPQHPQQEQQEHDWREGPQQPEQAAAAAPQRQRKQRQQRQPQDPEPVPIVGEHKSEWAPPPAPQLADLPSPPGGVRAEGTGHEVLLQAFNWESANAGDWWGQVERAAGEIAAAGFSLAWLPPPTQSVSRQGYMPTDLYNLNGAYGSADSLKRCVRGLQGAGVKVLADVVINHRCAAQQDEQGVWNVFGGKLAWNADAIVGDHFEFRGRGNESSGDPFPAAPNLDHSADFVKRDLSEWLAWMRGEMGFDGWRFDFARGYGGEHVADYCEATGPEFAVAEFWDSLAYRRGVALRNQDAHRGRMVAWMKAAGGGATAFDMTTKGILHQAFERGDLSRLKDSAGKPPGLIGWWPSHAVTFLENHDTGSTQGHWRFPGKRVEAGHAYIMTHPGTPCIFWDHWRDGKMRDVIERLVKLRREQGINCRSSVEIHKAQKELYLAEIDGKVLVKVGAAGFQPEDGDGWRAADQGSAWAVWLRS